MSWSICDLSPNQWCCTSLYLPSCIHVHPVSLPKPYAFISIPNQLTPLPPPNQLFDEPKYKVEVDRHLNIIHNRLYYLMDWLGYLITRFRKQLGELDPMSTLMRILDFSQHVPIGYTQYCYPPNSYNKFHHQYLKIQVPKTFCTQHCNNLHDNYSSISHNDSQMANMHVQSYGY